MNNFTGIMKNSLYIPSYNDKGNDYYNNQKKTCYYLDLTIFGITANDNMY